MYNEIKTASGDIFTVSGAKNTINFTVMIFSLTAKYGAGFNHLKISTCRTVALGSPPSASGHLLPPVSVTECFCVFAVTL